MILSIVFLIEKIRKICRSDPDLDSDPHSPYPDPVPYQKIRTHNTANKNTSIRKLESDEHYLGDARSQAADEESCGVKPLALYLLLRRLGLFTNKVNIQLRSLESKYRHSN